MLVHHAIQPGLESCFVALLVVGVKDRREVFEFGLVCPGFIVDDSCSPVCPVYPVDISFHVNDKRVLERVNLE